MATAGFRGFTGVAAIGIAAAFLPAQQSALPTTMRVKADEIGGVVSSSKGAEAGVAD
jgi:hypothetical protein